MPQLIDIIELKRPIQYETLKFDTLDGDLHKGQYAIDELGILHVRMHPENNLQWRVFDPADGHDLTKLSAGLTKVNIIPNEHCYYYEYVLKDGSERIVRFPISKEEYEDGKKKDAVSIDDKEPKPTKSEIDKIKKDDDKWL